LPTAALVPHRDQHAVATKVSGFLDLNMEGVPCVPKVPEVASPALRTSIGTPLDAREQGLKLEFRRDCSRPSINIASVDRIDEPADDLDFSSDIAYS
jgi:hypothetical protein